MRMHILAERIISIVPTWERVIDDQYTECMGCTKDHLDGAVRKKFTIALRRSAHCICLGCIRYLKISHYKNFNNNPNQGITGLVRLFCEVVDVAYCLIVGLTNGYDKPKPIQDW